MNRMKNRTGSENRACPLYNNTGYISSLEGNFWGKRVRVYNWAEKDNR
jgi:hypothetical protein